jgi:hypothetical protein
MKLDRNAFVLLSAVLLVACFWLSAGGAFAYKEAANRPYVETGADGAFYARCIPAEKGGGTGTTTIYRVAVPKDEEVDTYNWYSKSPVHLGWSPKVGKVAVMAERQTSDEKTEQQEELGLYLGGKLVNKYTTDNLLKMGADLHTPGYSKEKRARFRVLGCIQVPGTNDYYFAVQIGKDQILKVDIVTGLLIGDAKPVAEK